MAFIEDAIFPVSIARGSSFSVQFNTAVQELAGGGSVRISRWAESGRRRYNIAYGIRSLANVNETEAGAGINKVVAFIIAMGGSFHAFKFKDWLDYATTPTGTLHNPGDAAVTAFDAILGVADDTTTTFQLRKQYDQAVSSLAPVRNLTKPKTGTTLIGVDASAVAASGAWNVDETTGKVTFVEPPGPSASNPDLAVSAGSLITGGCEFWTPARFEKSVDDGPEISLENLLTGSIPELRIIEELASTAYDERYNYGGAINHGNMNGANVLLSLLAGRCQIFEPAVAGLKAIFPDTENVPLGGPLFKLKNNGSEDIDIEDDGGATFTTLTSGGGSIEVYLGVTGGGAKVWIG